MTRSSELLSILSPRKASAPIVKVDENQKTDPCPSYDKKGSSLFLILLGFQLHFVVENTPIVAEH